MWHIYSNFIVGRASDVRVENCCFVSLSPPRHKSCLTKINWIDLEQKIWRFFTQNTSSEREEKETPSYVWNWKCNKINILYIFLLFALNESKDFDARSRKLIFVHHEMRSFKTLINNKLLTASREQQLKSPQRMLSCLLSISCDLFPHKNYFSIFETSEISCETDSSLFKQRLFEIFNVTAPNDESLCERCGSTTLSVAINSTQRSALRCLLLSNFC